MAEENIIKINKNEIIWHVINSVLAAGLVFMGALTTGNITLTSIIIAMVAGGIVALSKLKDYWESEKKEYTSKLFSFVR